MQLVLPNVGLWAEEDSQGKGHVETAANLVQLVLPNEGLWAEEDSQGKGHVETAASLCS